MHGGFDGNGVVAYLLPDIVYTGNAGVTTVKRIPLLFTDSSFFPSKKPGVQKQNEGQACSGHIFTPLSSGPTCGRSVGKKLLPSEFRSN